MSRSLKLTWASLAFIIVAAASPVLADTLTINIGTTGNAANYLMTGAGAVNSPSAQVGGGISLTSNATRTGTFIPGANLAAFNGFYFADLQFFLPANATGVTLNFSNFQADDRGVLQLNGVNIGNTNVFNQTGVGVMSFPPGPPDVPFFFTGTTNTFGTITSGFLLGSMNTLRLVVNNTDSGGIGDPTRTFQFDAAGTSVFLNGSVTYSTPNASSVPEPTTMLLLGTGLAGVAMKRRKRRQANSDEKT